MGILIRITISSKCTYSIFYAPSHIRTSFHSLTLPCTHTFTPFFLSHLSSTRTHTQVGGGHVAVHRQSGGLLEQRPQAHLAGGLGARVLCQREPSDRGSRGGDRGWVRGACAHRREHTMAAGGKSG